MSDQENREPQQDDRKPQQDGGKPPLLSLAQLRRSTQYLSRLLTNPDMAEQFELMDEDVARYLNKRAAERASSARRLFRRKPPTDTTSGQESPES